MYHIEKNRLHKQVTDFNEACIICDRSRGETLASHRGNPGSLRSGFNSGCLKKSGTHIQRRDILRQTAGLYFIEYPILKASTEERKYALHPRK